MHVTNATLLCFGIKIVLVISYLTCIKMMAGDERDDMAEENIDMAEEE